MYKENMQKVAKGIISNISYLRNLFLMVTTIATMTMTMMAIMTTSRASTIPGETVVVSSFSWLSSLLTEMVKYTMRYNKRKPVYATWYFFTIS